MVSLEYVVRTVGERTEKVCVELVRRQKAGAERISILREGTHVGAIEKTFQIGLKSEADWLIAIDADMLFLPDAVSKIRDEISLCDPDVFVIHPAIFDKLYRMKRWGVTAYRMSMLEDLYTEFMKLRNKPHTKIEGAAIKELRKRNKKAIFSRNVAAIHDYEQYYKDLYRKAYLNAIRNPGTRVAGKQWRKWAKHDPDYLVILLGYEDALTEKRTLTNSVNDFDVKELQGKIKSLGLEEKEPLEWGEFADSEFAETMSGKIYNPSKDRIFADFFEADSMMSKLKKLVKNCLPSVR